MGNSVIIYLIYKNFLDSIERENYLNLELWKPENWAQYVKQIQESNREKYAESAKYKQYKRYLKQQKGL
jgi:hypothetical protein